MMLKNICLNDSVVKFKTRNRHNKTLRDRVLSSCSRGIAPPVSCVARSKHITRNLLKTPYHATSKMCHTRACGYMRDCRQLLHTPILFVCVCQVMHSRRYEAIIGRQRNEMAQQLFSSGTCVCFGWKHAVRCMHSYLPISSFAGLSFVIL